MGNIFNMDNKFFSFLSRLADLAILNIIFLISCIPIITIGPSLTALYYVTLKMVKNEESYIVRSFFKSFRQNLKQGILIHLGLTFLGFSLYQDIRIARSLNGSPSLLLLCFFVAAAMMFLSIFLYIYPVLAKFDNTIKNTVINAFIMSIRHLPYTILMLLISVSPVIAFFIPQQAASILLFFLFIMGGAGIAFCNSLFLVRIFEKYIPQDSEVQENTII